VSAPTVIPSRARRGAEHLVALADADRLRAEVAVEPTVVADARGRRNAPRVVGNLGATRDQQGVTHVFAVGERLRQVVGRVGLAEPQG